MVITDVNQVVYLGDGVTTAFPFTFRIIDATDVKLLLIDADGTETDITSDYFVDTNTNTVYYPGYAPGAEPGLADQPVPVQEGQRLVVYRELPVTQEKDLGEKWPFYVIELALDKLTMLIQQVKGIWDRCLKVSVGQEATAPDFNYTVPIEAGKTFRVKDDGTGFELTEDPAVAHAAAVAAQEAAERAQGAAETAQWKAEDAQEDAEEAAENAEAALDLIKEKATWFDNVAAMKAAAGLQVGMLAGTKGYYSINDGGASIYAIRAKTQEDVDDGINIIILDNGNVAEKIQQPFLAINMYNAKLIPDNSDLNNYTTPGTYYTLHGENTATIKNIPFLKVKVGCRLVVSQMQRSNVILQEFFTNTLYKYYRTRNETETSWTEWKKLANTENVADNTGTILFIEYDLPFGGQDAVYYDGKLFIFPGSNQKKMRVYNWEEKSLIGEYNLGGSINSHGNTLTWGHKQNDSDPYPLLYSSGYNGIDSDGETNLPWGTCQVYKIHADYSTDLVQDIRIDFINDPTWAGNGSTTGSIKYGDFVVDNDNNYLYAITVLVEDGRPKTRVFKFALPDTTNASVTLSLSDILDQYDLPYHPWLQGATYNNGFIYLSSGYNYYSDDTVYLTKIDLTQKAEVWSISLNSIMSEAEGVVVIGGNLYVGKDIWYRVYGIDGKAQTFIYPPYIGKEIPVTDNSAKVATTKFVNSRFAEGGTINKPLVIDGVIFVGPASEAVTTGSGKVRVCGNIPELVTKCTNYTLGTLPSGTVNCANIFIGDSTLTQVGVLSWIEYSNDSGLLLMRVRNSSSASRQVELMVNADQSSDFRAGSDNKTSLGSSARRWTQLFAGTATISTSDERLKDNITDIPDAVLDAWGEVGWYQYQFKDSIEEKGKAKARLHTGAIAQRIESVFNAHGLDANRYGLLCYDEWKAEPAERDEDGNIIQEARPAGNRYSLRYEEALCMEAAYQRRRADRLEERIARLEAKL